MRQIRFERLRFVSLLCEMFEQLYLFDGHEFDRCGGKVKIISAAHLRSRALGRAFVRNLIGFLFERSRSTIEQSRCS